jgi:hypothetical protein
MVMDMGYQIKELEYSREKTKCCGYGGMVFYANRDQAKDFADDRILESNEGLNEDLNDDLVVYCAMCRDLFSNSGKRTFHILDLIFAEEPGPAAEPDRCKWSGEGSPPGMYAMKKMPSLSDRRANRAGLKKKLLRELWNECGDESSKGKTNLSIPQTVLDAMEERLILFEDVEDVLEHSRQTGQRFFNTEDNSFLAGFRKKNVTDWARWTEKEDGAHILNVYSHRMAVN